MLKYNEFQNALESLSFKHDEYKAEIEETDIGVPYLIYQKTESNSFIADSIVFLKLTLITADLIVDELGDEHIKEFEDFLEENEVSYSRTIEYSDANRLFEILYTFTLIDE